MFRLISRWIVAAALLLSLGWNWGIVQVGAWAVMVHERIPEMGFSAAFVSVVKGEAPCHRCAAIQQKRSEERQTPSKPVDPTLKILIAGALRDTFVAHRPPILMRLETSVSDRRLDFLPELPSPPPKQA